MRVRRKCLPQFDRSFTGPYWIAQLWGSQGSASPPMYFDTHREALAYAIYYTAEFPPGHPSLETS